jgi:DNA repair exonuclease SbcCD ATPase subunit
MLLNSLQLNNFLSHSNSTINFKENYKGLIDGKSGSGKSSIVEAILFVLFGQGRCDNKMSLIKRGTDKATVIIELVDKDSNIVYQIKRSIDKKNKHELSVLENDTPAKVKGISETQVYIEKNILHSSYLLFINSILYKQDNQDTFVNQTASKRKDLLLEIVNANSYDEYLKKTKEAIAKIKTNQEVVLAKIEGKQNEINNNQITASKLEEYQKEETRLQQEIDNLKLQYTELTTKEKATSDKLIVIRGQEEKMELILKDYNVKSNRIQEINKKLIELSSVDINAIKKEIEDLDEVKKQIKGYDDAKDNLMSWNSQRMTIYNETPANHDYQTEIDAVNRQLIDIIGNTTGQCPKCGYIDPEREQKKQNDITSLDGRLKALNSDFEAYKKNVAVYATKLADLGAEPTLPMFPAQYSALKAKLDSLDGLTKQLITAENSDKIRIELTTELETINQAKNLINDEVKQIEIQIGQKDVLYQEGRQLKEDIIKINGTLENLMTAHIGNNQLLGIAKHATQQIIKSKEELTILQQNLNKDGDSLESLELLKGAFGPNGLKAIVIDYVIPQLEDKINNILSKLSDLSIRLDTQKGGLGEDVILEGLFITVINDVGDELEYQNFSGGEKIKISVAINEALAELSKINFRILDETIVALDNDSVQNFLVAMNEILLKVHQFICISHIPAIKELFEDKITVTKINGNSTINI